MGQLIFRILIFILVFTILIYTGTSVLAYTYVNKYKEEIFMDLRNEIIEDVSVEDLSYRKNILNRERRDLILNALSDVVVDNENIDISKVDIYSDNDLPVTINSQTYNTAGVYLFYTLTIPLNPLIDSVDITLEEYIEANTFLAFFEKGE